MASQAPDLDWARFSGEMMESPPAEVGIPMASNKRAASQEPEVEYEVPSKRRTTASASETSHHEPAIVEAGPSRPPDLDYLNVSEEVLVDACASGDYPTIGGGYEFGRPLILVARDTIVKFGVDVTAAEAAAQDFVHQRADPAIFRVPKVHRFFEAASELGNVGYLVMEFIKGTAVDRLDESAQSRLSPRLARCLKHLWQIPVPLDASYGPVGGGGPGSYIWADNGACVTFDTLQQMEHWLNETLEADETLAKMGGWDTEDQLEVMASMHKRLYLANYPLVMCHGDFASRNIILGEDGTIYILDWAFAAYYPLFFDLYSIACNEKSDAALLSPLIQELFDFTANFITELELLNRIQRINNVMSRLGIPMHPSRPSIPSAFTAPFPNGLGRQTRSEHLLEMQSNLPQPGARQNRSAESRMSHAACRQPGCRCGGVVHD